MIRPSQCLSFTYGAEHRSDNRFIGTKHGFPVHIFRLNDGEERVFLFFRLCSVQIPGRLIWMGFIQRPVLDKAPTLSNHRPTYEAIFVSAGLLVVSHQI